MGWFDRLLCRIFGHPGWKEYIKGGGGLDHNVPAGKKCIQCGKDIKY